jgi:hypothetical protein
MISKQKAWFREEFLSQKQAKLWQKELDKCLGCSSVSGYHSSEFE